MGAAPSLAHAQDFPAAGGCGQERVEPAHGGITKACPLLFEAIGLADARVDVNSERLVARPRPACPCSFQQLPSYLVQAAGVAEGKTAQESPQRRRGRHPGAEKLAGTPRAQHVGVVDRVTAHERRSHQGRGLLAHVGMPGGIAQVHPLIHQFWYVYPRSQAAWVADAKVIFERDGLPRLNDSFYEHQEKREVRLRRPRPRTRTDSCRSRSSRGPPTYRTAVGRRGAHGGVRRWPTRTRGHTSGAPGDASTVARPRSPTTHQRKC